MDWISPFLKPKIIPQCLTIMSWFLSKFTSSTLHIFSYSQIPRCFFDVSMVLTCSNPNHHHLPITKPSLSMEVAKVRIVGGVQIRSYGSCAGSSTEYTDQNPGILSTQWMVNDRNVDT